MTVTLERQDNKATRSEAVAPVAEVAEQAVPGMPALLIEHLTKSFEVGGRKKRKTVHAVNDVSLRIERGEIYGVLGANGSGKSTFIRLVSTLLTVDQGRVAGLRPRHRARTRWRSSG